MQAVCDIWYLFIVNLADYYTQQQVFQLTGLDHRFKLLRWLAKWAKAGFPVDVVYICRKPFYPRNQIDAILYEEVGDNALARWALSEKIFSVPKQFVDLDEWILQCQAMKLWRCDRRWLWWLSQAEKKNGFPMIRIKRIRWMGAKRDALVLYNKADIERVVNKYYAGT